MGQAGKVYDETAILYDLRTGNPYTEWVRGIEARLIARHASGKALDAGCGTGYHLRALKKVQGVDVSGEMVKLARKTGKAVMKASIENLPFRKDKFGTSLCMYSVLNLVDWKAAVQELCRVSKEKVIISVSSIYDKNYSGVEAKKNIRIDKYTQTKKIHIKGKKLSMHLFTREELIKEFRKNGFALEEFDSAFRGVRPHWNLWKRLSLGERFGLFMDKFRPVEYGAFYFMVFKKGRQ
jgi:ubiquinone/menaquinone biosynthesis C-methylase UbiE